MTDAEFPTGIRVFRSPSRGFCFEEDVAKMQLERSSDQNGGRPVALSIAGSDSGGGAGIQADLHTFAAFGVHGTVAITAVTAQNTRGVTDVHRVPAAALTAQIVAVLDDFPVGAIKIGMLATPSIARTVAAVLGRYPHIPIVLDPVLVATTGARLGTGDLVGVLRRHWLSRADLLTPNIPEAERLLDRVIRTPEDMHEAAADLLDRGARAVLMKGGHLASRRISDLLLTKDVERWFHHPRLRGDAHGTGCTLSAATAAGMARGDALELAVEQAIDYVHQALRRGYRPGKGDLLVLDHASPMSGDATRRVSPTVDR